MYMLKGFLSFVQVKQVEGIHKKIKINDSNRLSVTHNSSLSWVISALSGKDKEFTVFFLFFRNADKTRYSEKEEVIWRDLLLPIPTDPKLKVDVSTNIQIFSLFSSLLNFKSRCLFLIVLLAKYKRTNKEFPCLMVSHCSQCIYSGADSTAESKDSIFISVFVCVESHFLT